MICWSLVSIKIVSKSKSTWEASDKDIKTINKECEVAFKEGGE